MACVTYEALGTNITFVGLGFRDVVWFLGFWICPWPLVEQKVSGVPDINMSSSEAVGFCQNCRLGYLDKGIFFFF